MPGWRSAIAKKRNIDDGPLYDPFRDSLLHDAEEDRTPTIERSASLCVYGESLDFEEIGLGLGLAPTTTQRRGDERSPDSSVVCLLDMWSYKVDVPAERPLEEHIDALWRDIKGSKEYLLALKERAKVEVFLTYSSDWIDGTVDIGPESLEMFTQLGVHFWLSLVRI